VTDLARILAAMLAADVREYPDGAPTSTSLAEASVRRSFTAMLDSYKAGALVRQSVASMKAAEAQERMAGVLAAMEHGGHALLMLSRLQEGLQAGPRRPLPGLRSVPALPSPPKDPA
jgi:hypothetical protein